MKDPQSPIHAPKHDQSLTFKIAVAAIFTALVFIVTSQVPAIPIYATGGYFNVGETTIYVAALLFGPLVGGIAGGVGASLSDAYLGFGIFAPGTLIIKFTEGAVTGFLNLKLKKYIKNATVTATLAVVTGGLVMVTGYFLYELIVLSYPLAAALAEVPLNIGQMAVGLVIAVPIMHAVMRVFPQLNSYM
jgi:uncharacterized membrane protein